MGHAKHNTRDQFGRFAKKPPIKRLTVTGDQFWNKYIPLSHEQAVEILTRDLPVETEIQLTLKGNGTGSIGMQAEGIFEESYSRYESSRRGFNLKEGTLGEGCLQVYSAHQGSGIGRHVLRNEMEFFYQCNVRRFNIHPSLEAGGYTWAKAGFVPDDVTDKYFIEYTTEPVQERYAAIRPYLDKEEVAVLDAAVKLEDPQDILRIAESGPINDGLIGMFNAMSCKDEESLNNQEARIKTSFVKREACYGRDVLMNIQSTIHEGKNVTVGQILLSGTDWNRGHVDMTDATQMARVGNYVGGWRYISP